MSGAKDDLREDTSRVIRHVSFGSMPRVISRLKTLTGDHLYVREKRLATVREGKEAYGEKSLATAIDEWQESSAELRRSVEDLFKTLEDSTIAR